MQGPHHSIRTFGLTTETQGRPRLKKAIADAHSDSFGRKIDPVSEVTITTGANEGTSVLVSPKPTKTNISFPQACLVPLWPSLKKATKSSSLSLFSTSPSPPLNATFPSP